MPKLNRAPKSASRSPRQARSSTRNGANATNDQTHPKQVRNLRGTNVLFKSDGDNVVKFLLLNG